MVYEALYAFDDAVRAQKGISLLCGVDEAGRGPLCGPVCCAAVILPPDARLDGLNDSKKVSPRQRERLYDEIVRLARAYSVVMVDNHIIDAINILQATMRGMRQAVQALTPAAEFALIDGNRLPPLDGIPAQAVVKGDAASASIAAASILAKVSRDRYMGELDARFPQYGFAQHKGYPTRAHYAAIEEYGLCEFHRKTFLKKRR